MKTSKLLIIAAFLSSAFTSHAITNTVIAVSGTNLVLSWPSYGYESYLIQYRQTLNLTDSWSQLTNAYPANSTNRTTFTIYGLVPPHGTNGSGGLGGSDSPPSPDEAASAPSEPMVMPANGSGTATPLAIYPVGFDLSGFVIFDPATGQWVSGKGYVIQPTASAPSGEIQPMDDSGGSTNVNTGFFRVFHIPDWLVSFSGYTFDGPTFLPVDYAAPDAPTNYIDSSTVLINGQPTDDAVFTSYDIGGTTYWGMGIYFDRFQNGTNTIQLLTTVRQSDTLDDQTPYMVFSNAPQTIVIGNLVTFTNWDDLILGSTYTFKAQTVTNVDWEIDIYDVYDNFVNYQTGHSSDGNISWTWDLTDYTGASRSDADSDPDFYPYITITQIVSSGKTQPDAGNPTHPMPTAAAQFPSVGAWLFAYLDNYYTDQTANYAGANSYYLGGIENMEGGPELSYIPTYDYPVKFGTNYSQADRDDSWSQLTFSYLGSSYGQIRNFYYFGHGAVGFIGGDINKLDSSNNITGSKNLPGSKAGLTSQSIRQNITFNKNSGAIPYRFVFLDGCNTASGDLPQAWGVPNQTETIDYYKSAANSTGARPSAFVGWDTEIGGLKGWGTIDKFWQFRTFWMGNWSVQAGQQNDGLRDVFNQALTGSNWVDQDHYNHMKIYGYQDMTFLQYNHAGDWPQ